MSGQVDFRAAGRALVAIDPGSAGRGNAFALFHGGELRRSGFAREVGEVLALTIGADGSIRAGEFPRGSAVVAERPEYQGARTKTARPQDLIALSWSGALLAGGLAALSGRPCIEVPPSAWKGARPKPQCHLQAWQVLTEDEREALGGEATARAIRAACEAGALERWAKPGVEYYPRAWVLHNVLDAAALGLVTLGRLSLTGRAL